MFHVTTDDTDETVPEAHETHIHNLCNSPLYDDINQINVRYHHYYYLLRWYYHLFIINDNTNKIQSTKTTRYEVLALGHT